jgi:hypothetical protein
MVVATRPSYLTALDAITGLKGGGAMNRLILTLAASLALPFGASPAAAQEETHEEEFRRVLADFVLGWREGDAEILSRGLALDEGRITWVSGQGDDQIVGAMTFGDAIARNRDHPDYGREGWEVASLDVVDDKLAVAKLRIPEGDVVNIDYLVCYRVAGNWRIVSNTFVIRDR